MLYMAHDERLLSVFVDESGNFGDPDDPARYCIVKKITAKELR